MDLFRQLACEVRRQNEEGELPDFIVPMLMKVADSPAEFAGQQELVATLLQYVKEYHTYIYRCSVTV